MLKSEPDSAERTIDFPGRRTKPFLPCALLCLVVCIGCGGSGRYPVSGSVALDGKPVAEGAISFRPDPGTRGNTAGATVVNGEYSIPAGNGLKPGTYDVSIETLYKTGRTLRDPQKGRVEEMLHVDYNERGQLKATIAAGKNEGVDFAITTRR